MYTINQWCAMHNVFLGPHDPQTVKCNYFVGATLSLHDEYLTYTTYDHLYHLLATPSCCEPLHKKGSAELDPASVFRSNSNNFHF